MTQRETQQATQQQTAVRERGSVRWFSPEKGYGFLMRENGSDVFVHHTAIQMEGYRTLEQNAVVEFDVVETPRGLSAKNVVAV